MFRSEFLLILNFMFYFFVCDLQFRKEKIWILLMDIVFVDEQNNNFNYLGSYIWMLNGQLNVVFEFG